MLKGCSSEDDLSGVFLIAASWLGVCAATWPRVNELVLRSAAMQQFEAMPWRLGSGQEGNGVKLWLARGRSENHFGNDSQQFIWITMAAMSSNVNGSNLNDSNLNSSNDSKWFRIIKLFLNLPHW